MSASRRKFIEWTNSRGFTLVLLGLCCVFCLGGVVLTYLDAVELRDHGVRAQAVVTAVHDGRRPYVTVRFTTREGKTVSADVGNYLGSPEPQVGDEPTVLYDPTAPSDNVADVRMGPDFLMPWLIGSGGVISAIAFVLTYTRRIDWLKIAKGEHGID